MTGCSDAPWEANDLTDSQIERECKAKLFVPSPPPPRILMRGLVCTENCYMFRKISRKVELKDFKIFLRIKCGV